ncbi:MAG: pentapeptide repeat-containing protein (plasmid) [Leptolyngbya sp. BL-A-14]
MAQSRTVLALQSLDRKRQHLVIQFLSASGLNDQPDKSWHLHDKEGLLNPLPAKNRVLLYRAQLSKANLVNSDLSGAMLVGTNLREANLSCDPPDSRDPNKCSDLSKADLRGANLHLAKLLDTNLSFANFEGANLEVTSFTGAYLYSANLRGADLSLAKLRLAHLSGANLSKAILLATDLHQTTDLAPEQLEGRDPPLLCGSALPEGFTVNPNRDCDRLPQILLERDPEYFKTLKDAQDFVNVWRQQKWTDELPGK